MQPKAGESFPFEITIEDVNEAAEFTNSGNCPFKRAFVRQFKGHQNIIVGIRGVYDHEIGRCIAAIDDNFDSDQYQELKLTGVPFKTKITFK